MAIRDARKHRSGHRPAGDRRFGLRPRM